MDLLKLTPTLLNILLFCVDSVLKLQRFSSLQKMHVSPDDAFSMYIDVQIA